MIKRIIRALDIVIVGLLALACSKYAFAGISAGSSSHNSVLSAAQSGGSTFTVHKFGRNIDSDTSEEDVHATDGVRVPLTAAVALEIVSSDADDTAAGTGAREVTIQCLGANFEIQADYVVATNGASASTPTSATCLRPYRAYVSKTGTYGGSNEGTLTIRVSGAGATQLTILAGFGQTETTHYTVPAGHEAYLMSVNVHVDSARDATFYMYRRIHDGDFSAPHPAKRLVLAMTGADTHVQQIIDGAVVFSEKTDIWISAVSGAVNSEVEADYILVVRKVN